MFNLFLTVGIMRKGKYLQCNKSVTLMQARSAHAPVSRTVNLAKNSGIFTSAMQQYAISALSDPQPLCQEPKWIERRPPKAKGVGSNPAGHSIHANPKKCTVFSVVILSTSSRLIPFSLATHFATSTTYAGSFLVPRCGIGAR